VSQAVQKSGHYDLRRFFRFEKRNYRTLTTPVQRPIMFIMFGRVGRVEEFNLSFIIFVEIEKSP
jgi:hypothetical protein